MRSDVLGGVLENIDLDGQIMDAIGADTPTEEVVANIEQTIDERKEALETVESNFLIRDRFDLSAEDREIIDMIERSREGEVSETDIEMLVREFFDEFGGEIRGVRPGPARAGGDVFQLEVPSVLTGDQVDRQYEHVTFTRDVAIEHDEVSFIALDHPLVQAVIDYCLDGDRVQGHVGAKVAAGDVSPGILFNYRLGYVAGSGEAVIEKFVRLYATEDRTVTTDVPAIEETLSPDETDHPVIERLATSVSSLHGAAEAEAWTQVEGFAQEARDEREREVTIKRQHAKQHFSDRISTWEDRLKTYHQRDDEGVDMSAPIGNARRNLEELRRERNQELAQFEEDKHVTPEEPTLVSAAFVLPEERTFDRSSTQG